MGKLLWPGGDPQFQANDGTPLTNGKIYSYEPGTTTNRATYQDSDLVTAHANPIILDANGRPPSGQIWLNDNTKCLVYDENDVLIAGAGGDNLNPEQSGFGSWASKNSAVLAKTAAYTLVSADDGKTIHATGTWTLNTTQAASVFGDGFTVDLINMSTGVITFDPNGSETINGASVLEIYPGDSFKLITDGTNWYAITLTNWSREIGQCRFIYTNTTTLTLKPHNGNLLLIDGRYWAIPDAGVTVDNSGLSADTFYYAYAYISSGAVTLELSTTAPSWLSAGNYDLGYYVKNGDAARTLVGYAHTADGATTFVSTTVERRVCSHFNRIETFVEIAASSVSSMTGTSYTETDTSLRVSIIQPIGAPDVNPAIQGIFTGAMRNDTVGGEVFAQLYYNLVDWVAGNDNGWGNASISRSQDVADYCAIGLDSSGAFNAGLIRAKIRLNTNGTGTGYINNGTIYLRGWR